jgi:GTP-binding protein HflX
VVALVGYTNAGKSTLFNRLTRSAVMAKDLLFATLDPTMRAVSLPSGRNIILSDTVGFISDLPTDLVAAFRATLEEVEGADVVLHVRDISHSDTAAQSRDVEGVLRDLGLAAQVDAGEVIEVLNKIDLLTPEARRVVLEQTGRADNQLPISAATGEGVEALLAAIDRRLTSVWLVKEYRLTHGDGAAIAWLHQHGEVMERRDDEEATYLKVRLDPADVSRFERMTGPRR